MTVVIQNDSFPQRQAGEDGSEHRCSVSLSDNDLWRVILSKQANPTGSRPNDFFLSLSLSWRPGMERAKLGRVGGSRWGWFLYIKFRASSETKRLALEIKSPCQSIMQYHH